MKFKTYILAVVILALTGSVSFGQDESLHVETNLVSVNVAITDATGKYVEGLRQDQFEIFDNRQKQLIANFSVQEAPVTYGFVYDMHPTTVERTAVVLDSLRAFTRKLRQGDSFFIVFFNERGCLKLDFVPTLEQLDKNLPERREPNSLYDAVYLAADKSRASRNLKRSLIIISDTADHHSHHTISDLSQWLRSLDIQVNTIIFDEENNRFYRNMGLENKRQRQVNHDATALDRAEMLDLSLKSGGTTYSQTAENGQMLSEIYQEIAAEMKAQYTISFYPSVADGQKHSLRIGLRDIAGSKKFVLTYRQNYQSPLPKN